MLSSVKNGTEMVEVMALQSYQPSLTKTARCLEFCLPSSFLLVFPFARKNHPKSNSFCLIFIPTDMISLICVIHAAA